VIDDGRAGTETVSDWQFAAVRLPKKTRLG